MASSPDREEMLRVTDPPPPAGPGRVLGGCAIGCVVLGLLVAGLGLAAGVLLRFGPSTLGEEEVRTAETGDATGPGDPLDPQAPDPPRPRPQEPPALPMEARYRPGPFVRVESLVPSGRLVPTIPTGSLPQGRTLANPWLVPGGQLRVGRLPAASPGAPLVRLGPSETTEPRTVVVRTPARLEVQARDAQGGFDVPTYLVEFAGYDGHFELPATIPTELGQVQAAGSDGATVHFALASAVRPGGQVAQPGESFDVTMRVSAVDADGRVSMPVERTLTVVAVGAGDVEVTLTMSLSTDLDLYVTDATGETVYYGHRQAAAGGHLDLDANAACSSNMGVNNEHTFWPTARAPSGTYKVAVGHYESCIGGRPVDYRITVRNCGETAVLSGTFGGTANSAQCFNPGPGTRGWCQEVVTFDVPPCPGRTL